MHHAYLGCEYSAKECENAINQAELPYTSLGEDQLVETIAEAISSGKIVGWFQGRMEFGARALGNRSLLADPRRADMREVINTKIKFRERFRPFAPSILEEYVLDFFHTDAESPFMEKVFLVREDKRSIIPAVTHVDGTGRLQTVSKATNPLYWKLIDAFRERTGVPIVLNTSLNENEPVVRTPAEAIHCFLRTSMDLLVLGTHVIDRTAIDVTSDVYARQRSVE
jgi:carbamoyltransferase